MADVTGKTATNRGLLLRRPLGMVFPRLVQEKVSSTNTAVDAVEKGRAPRRLSPQRFGVKSFSYFTAKFRGSRETLFVIASSLIVQILVEDRP